MSTSNQVKASEQATYHHAQELGGLELLKASYQQQNFSRHTHEGYTVGVIESGAQQFYRTGGNHIAQQYSIILVNADQVHTGCAASQGGWSYRAIYPTPEQFYQADSNTGISLQGAPYFPNAVVEDPAMAGMLRHCFSVLECSDNRLLRESLLISCLQRLVERHSIAKGAMTAAPCAKPQLLRAKQLLDEAPELDISLEELAALAGISQFHFIRQFQRHYELSPHAYQIQARLRKAKQLIRLGNSLSTAAQGAGFHDQSHFHRHFKAAMGITPGRFAKQIRKNVQNSRHSIA